MFEFSTSPSGRDADPGSASAGEGARPANPRTCPLLMIVEDERLTAIDLKRRIKSYGYDLVPQVAITAGEAVELAQFHLPDLVLMDVRLKGGPDGIDAAEVILEELGYLPIIYLTAFRNDETLRRAKDLKSAGFHFKPIDFQSLNREIADALNWRVQ